MTKPLNSLVKSFSTLKRELITRAFLPSPYLPRLTGWPSKGMHFVLGTLERRAGKNSCFNFERNSPKLFKRNVIRPEISEICVYGLITACTPHELVQIHSR